MNNRGIVREARWIFWTVAGLGVLYLGFVALLWRIGLFDLPKADASGEAFAAVTGLLGGLAVALTTFVSVLLKLSLDSRSLRIQQQAEDRLNMETCLRAVELMGKAPIDQASESGRSGALFALANLGQLTFSLTLLSRLWPAKEIDSSSAIWLIGQGLEASNEETQYQAALILFENAGRLKKTDQIFEWPTCLDMKWMPSLNYATKELVIQALLNCIMSNPLANWRWQCMTSFIAAFYLMMIKDDHPSIKASAVMVLSVLLPVYPEHIKSINTFGETFDVAELHKQVVASVNASKALSSLEVHELVHSLEEWASACT